MPGGGGGGGDIFQSSVPPTKYQNCIEQPYHCFISQVWGSSWMVKSYKLLTEVWRCIGVVEVHDASLTSSLDGSKWSAARPCRFNPRDRASGMYSIVRWVGPRVGQDAVVKRKILSPCRDSSPWSSMAYNNVRFVSSFRKNFL